MKKVIAFGASSSSQSINKQLAVWAAHQLRDTEVVVLDLNDYEMPLYSTDRESRDGIPAEAIRFKNELKSADGVIISFAEHNGSYAAAFKNILDWVSRIEKGTWANKPMLLLSSSPGPRGAQGVLQTAVNSFPRQGGEVMGHYSLPSFGQNFNSEEGIIDPDRRVEFESQLDNFQARLHALESVSLT